MPGIWSGILALSCVSVAGAQVTFRSDVNLATVAVRVTNLAGREVRGLSAGDFILLEDGRPQKIAFFTAENEPVSLLVLLDASSSMRSSGKYSTAKAALSRLLDAVAQGSQVFVAEFSDRIESFKETTAAASQPEHPETGPSSAGTALYDAISFGLCTLRSARYSRQILVVLTDGADRDSRLRLPELLHAVSGSLAQVFVLGYFNQAERQHYESENRVIGLPDGSDVDNPDFVFQSIAHLSGAEVAYADSEEGVRRGIERIRQRVVTQYSLSYYLEPGTKPNRRIQVKVKRFGMRIYARPGFSDLGVPIAGRASGTGCLVTAKEHPYPFETRITTGPDGLRVYRDDLRDPASGWPKRDSFYYGAEGYHLIRNHASGWIELGLTEVHLGSWWGDFRASVTVWFSGDTPPGSAGLAFRVNENRGSSFGNRMGLYSLLVSDASRTIELKDVGEPKPIELFIGAIRPQGPKRIGVECVGSEIRILLNGKVLGVVNDRARTSGMIGLALEGAGHAVFRDLVVEELTPWN